MTSDTRHTGSEASTPRERMSLISRDSAEDFIQFSGPHPDGEYVLLVGDAYDCKSIAMTKRDVAALRSLLLRMTKSHRTDDRESLQNKPIGDNHGR